MSHHNSHSPANGEDEPGPVFLDDTGPVGAAIDDEEEAHQSDSSVEELQDQDFPSYFSERNGRLYHSHLTSPYRLPVDTPEQERLTVNHNILKRFIGDLYRDAADMVLPNSTANPKALDLCCGNGKWILEMACRSPHAQFVGVDIVPIATRYPPPNVQFELLDVNSRLRWDDFSFDLIHCRDALMCVLDYASLLDEVTRLLRPGGVYISVEWSNRVELHPDFPGTVEEVAPATVHFFDTLDHILSGLGVNIDGAIIANVVGSCGHFTNTASQRIDIPIGQWDHSGEMPMIGNSLRTGLTRMANGFKQLFFDCGMTEEEVDVLISGFVDEMRDIEGLVAVVNVTYGERV